MLNFIKKNDFIKVFFAKNNKKYIIRIILILKLINNKKNMFELPKLPFEKNALEPIISAETLDFHHWKHHQAYVTNLNNFISADTSLEWKTLEEIIVSSEGWVYNNAAQVWNHTFYWNCLRSVSEDNTPSEELLEKINATFWSFEEFKTKFSAAAIWNFGSGWTWLAQNASWELEIISTDDAQTLVWTDSTPLLVIDVWEHAYYIDFRNARPNYVEDFWKLVNWEFVAGNM